MVSAPSKREQNLPYLLRIGLHPGFWLVLLVAAQTLIYGFPDLAKDPGLGWHLASGEWMTSNGAIPSYDPFLSISRPWISDQWLSDLIFILIFKIAGWKGLYILVFALFSLLIFNFHFSQLRKETKGFWPVIIGTLFAIKAMHVHFIIRPVIFSFPLCALLVWRLRRWEKREALPLWLPVLFLLWTNLHPSFVLGIALLGMGFCAVLLQRRISRDELLLVAASILATLINPNGIKLHQSILFLGQSHFFMNLNEEWIAPSLNSSAGFLILLIAGLGLIPTLFLSKLRARTGWFLIFAHIAFLAATLSAIRFLPYYGIIGSILLTHSLGWIVWRLRKAKIILRFLLRWAKKVRSIHWVIPQTSLITIIFLLCFVMVKGYFPLTRVNEFGPPADKFPYRAISFLKVHQLRTIASTPDWGGFITWAGNGDLKPVIDDRNTLLGEQPYRDYFEGIKSSEALIAWAQNQNADAILLPKKIGLTLNLTPTYEDANSIVIWIKREF